MTFANVVALIALFVALNTTGFASPVVNTAASVGGTVKKALRLSKAADKNANRALGLAKQADKKASEAQAKVGPPGPIGAQGPKGESGAQGPKGDKGDTGLPGTMVVARPRGTTDQTSTNAYTAYPVTSNEWIQKTNESNFVYGVVNATVGPCTGVSFSGFLDIRVYVDGTPVGFGGINVPATGEPPAEETALIPIQYPVYEPAAPTNRTLTMQIMDDCTSGQHPVVHSARLTVVAIS
jgi:hypothetical protein